MTAVTAPVVTFVLMTIEKTERPETCGLKDAGSSGDMLENVRLSSVLAAAAGAAVGVVAVGAAPAPAPPPVPVPPFVVSSIVSLKTSESAALAVSLTVMLIICSPTLEDVGVNSISAVVFVVLLILNNDVLSKNVKLSPESMSSSDAVIVISNLSSTKPS